MFKCVLYGILVECNYDFFKDLHLLSQDSACFDNIEHHMRIKIDVYDNNPFSHYGVGKINENEYYFHTCDCCYQIGKGYIYVFCKNINIFLETFLNIPFSIYFLINDLGVLLHCSAVYNKNFVLAFSGKKGIGKSTILEGFLKHNIGNYYFYSDDTLRVVLDKNNECYSSLPFVKITGNADDFSSKKYYYSSSNKFFVPLYEYDLLDGTMCKKQIKKIFYLTQRATSLEHKLIVDSNMKFILMANNISGFSSFTESLKELAISKLGLYCDSISVELVSLTDNKLSLEGDLTKLIGDDRVERFV